MKKKLYIFIVSMLMCFKMNAQCSGNELAGKVTITPPAKEKILTYNIYHGFMLMPGSPTLPVVKAISYNHCHVKEISANCSDAKVVPLIQPPGFDPLKRDTIIDGVILNNQVPVNLKITPIPPSGTIGAMTDSVYTASCVSKAKASTCITINPFGPGMPLTGEIQNYGFGQSINPPLFSDAWAISLGDVSAESTKKLKSGAIVWIPWVESTVGGKAHGVRQKAGTSDPINYFVHNYNTNSDSAGTLLTISMIFYTGTDTFTYINRWKNDTVRIESDSAEFHIAFPSPQHTSLQGTLFVKVEGGVVTQATGTGFFSSVPLPTIGAPVPVIFPLQNLLQFSYDLGNYGNDSLLVRINMYGNSINNHVPAAVPIQVNDSVNRPKCNGNANGSIYLSVTGDYPPFTYLWNNGSQAQNRINLKAKTFTVTVTDSQGNFITKEIVVTQPAKLKVTFTKTNVKCGGKSTGKATANVTGGTSPYNYFWNSGETTATISAKPAGTYTVTVIDTNLCVIVKSVVITENPPLSLSAFPLMADSAVAIAIGGIPPYTYKWFTTPNQFNDTAIGLISGNTYQVKVTDSKICTATIFYAHPFSRMAADLNEEKGISLTPNPTTGLVTVSFENAKSNTHLFKLFDVAGKLLFEKTMTETSNNFNIDFSWLQKGVYVLTVTDSDKTRRIKLIRN